MTKLILIHPQLYDSPKDAVLLESFASDVIPLPYDGITKEQLLAYGSVSQIAFLYHFPGDERLPFFNDMPTATTATTATTDSEGEVPLEPVTSKYFYFSDSVIDVITSLRDAHSGPEQFIVDILSCDINSQSYRNEVALIESDLNIDIRYSVDKTGNASSGANWVLESDNVNIRDSYFTENILNWTGILTNAVTFKNGTTKAAFIKWNATTKTYTVQKNFTLTELGIAEFSKTAFIILEADEIFDGNNKTINFESTISVQGLFATASTITSLANAPIIKNLGIFGGTTGSGGFIVRSTQKYFKVKNCYTNSSINGFNSGGIAGLNSGKDGSCTINNCYSFGDISGEGAGGIAGSGAGWLGFCKITNCYSTDKINGRYAGGIVGSSAGVSGGSCTIENCYSTATITGYGAGGIAGGSSASIGTTAGRFGSCIITNCYTTRAFGAGASGIAQINTSNTNSCIITNCVSNPDLSSLNTIPASWTANTWVSGLAINGITLPILIAFRTEPWIISSSNSLYYKKANDGAKFITATVPDAPTDVTGTPQDGKVEVAFVAPINNGGAAITSYTVTSSGGQTESRAFSPITVTGLENGTAYTFTVTATNASGISDASIASAPVTTMTLEQIEAAALRSSLSSELTETLKDNIVTQALSAKTGLVNNSSATLDNTGLTSVLSTNLRETRKKVLKFIMASQQTINVTALALKLSSFSESTVVKVMTDVPTVGNDRILDLPLIVSIDKPVYVYDPQPGIIKIKINSNYYDIVINQDNTYTYNGASYNVGDYIILENYKNTFGSIESQQLTVPGAPTDVSAVSGNGQVDVAFVAPAKNGGTAISSYVVTSYINNIFSTSLTKDVETDKPISPITVTGLTNGIAYTFTVKAVNSIGESVSSVASSSVTPATVPDAPTVVIATASNAQATVTFAAPSNNGGAAITSYTVNSSDGQTITDTSSPITVYELQNGVAYTFTVIATNSEGNSIASVVSASVTPATVPDAPTVVIGTPQDSKVSIAFAAPSNNGGAAITSYTVTSSGGQTATGASSPLIVSNLTNREAYTFTVTATNSEGNSIASVVSASVIPVASSSTLSSSSSASSSPSTSSSAPGYSSAVNIPVTVNLNVEISPSGTIQIFGQAAIPVSDVVIATAELPVTGLYDAANLSKATITPSAAGEIAANSMFEFWEPEGESNRGDIKATLSGKNADSVSNGRNYRKLTRKLVKDIQTVLENSFEVKDATPFNDTKYKNIPQYEKVSNFGELALRTFSHYLLGHIDATAAITNEKVFVQNMLSQDGLGQYKGRNIPAYELEEMTNRPGTNTDANLAELLVQAIVVKDDTACTVIAKQVLGQDASRAMDQDNNLVAPNVRQALKFIAGDVIYMNIKLKQPNVTVSNNAQKIKEADLKGKYQKEENYTLKITLAGDAPIIPVIPVAEPMILKYNVTNGEEITLPLTQIGASGVSVNWGDATLEETFTSSGNKSHTYESGGEKTVTISGSLLEYGSSSAPSPKLIEVVSFGSTALTSLAYAFRGASILTKVPLSIPSTVTNMDYMFAGATAFNQNIGNWDVSNVTNMSGMFQNATLFNQNIGGWNVSNATNMSSMFSDATTFNQNIGGWSTTNVTNMSAMFSGAIVFNQNIGGWTTSNVTIMGSMFRNATSFNQDIGTWNVSNVLNMSEMFAGATTFNQNIDGWNVSNVTNMSYMFLNATAFNENIDGWNVSNVTNMSNMFQNATAFNQDIDGWSTINVTNMRSMFSNATSFNRNIGGWTTTNVTNMSYMFSNATVFNQNIGGWIITNVTNMNNMFAGATTFNQNIDGWNVSNVTNMSYMFLNATAFNENIDGWNVSNVTNMSNMFQNATAFNQDIDGWSTINVTNMRSMFSNATSFNRNIGGWTTTNVTNMSGMFAGASAFNGNISGWTTINVTDMNSMFFNALAFNQDIGGWTTSNVTNMSGMFASASAFNQNIGGWTTSNVLSMSGMFASASAFNQDIGSWIVSNVTDMSYMFISAISFNKYIGGWTTTNITNMSFMFSNAQAFNQDISEWDVSNVTNMSGMFNSALSFNQDIGRWDVLSVTTMNIMFQGASAFNGDISEWTPTNVVNMDSMFWNALAFNQYIGDWDVSNVTSMNKMFDNATSFNGNIGGWTTTNVITMNRMFAGASAFNQNIGLWNVSNVINISTMFENALAFDQNIGGWNVSNVTAMNDMLLNTALSTANYDALLIGWAIQTVKPSVSFSAGTTKYNAAAAAARAILTGAPNNWNITDGGL